LDSIRLDSIIIPIAKRENWFRTKVYFIPFEKRSGTRLSDLVLSHEEDAPCLPACPLIPVLWVLCKINQPNSPENRTPHSQYAWLWPAGAGGRASRAIPQPNQHIAAFTPERFG